MRYILLVLLCLLLSTCEKKIEKETPPPESVAEYLKQPLDLDKEVAKKAPPLISVNDPIELTFLKPVVPRHMVGSILDKSPFVFEPGITGKAQWLSLKEIRFQPDKPLTPGTSFKATFKGKIAFGSQKSVNDFTFTFKTAEQEIVDFSGDFIPAKTGKNMVQFYGKISFAQPVEIKKIEKDLKCKKAKKNIKFKLKKFPDDAAQIIITTDALQRITKGQIITFTLPKSYTVGQKRWKKDILLPAAYVFKVIAHMDMTDPEAAQSVYGFRFSDPIKTKIDLSGFISVSPEVPYTTSIKGKYLKIQGNFRAGESYTITIAQGFPSALGTKLKTEYTTSFSFKNIKPQAVWLSKGIYLPSKNNFKLQFKSVNVGKVHVTVTEIFNNNLGFFIQNNVLKDLKQGRHYHSSSYSDLHRVGKVIYSDTLYISTTLNTWEKSELNLSPVFKNKSNSAFIVSLKFNKDDLCGRCINDRNEIEEGELYYDKTGYYDNPCRWGYYYNKGTINKLLIASDIGLTVKEARDGIHVFATDIINAKPAAGITLSLYTYLNQHLRKVTTDNNGHALFTDTSGYYIKGENNAGLTLIKLNHPSWEVNNFDVSGVNEGQDGINTFMYTDRGVHRPGDTAHLSLIVRTNRKAPPKDQPVLLKVLNPKRQVVHEVKEKCGENGHVYFPIPTDISDPTGNWEAEITVAGKTFSKRLKIETVKPNRLKINIDLPDTLYADMPSLKGMLQSKYLFGTPASNCKARLKIVLRATLFNLPAFDEYTFTHPLVNYQQRTRTIFEKPLDAAGEQSIYYYIDDRSNAPSLLGATIKATVYEKGGSFTRDAKYITIVPYSAFVGIKDIFQWGRARLGEKYTIPIVVTDIHGKPVAGHKLKVKWYVNRQHWWWDYDRRNKRDFRSNQSTFKIGDFTYISGAKPIKHRFEAEDYGLHLLEVTDEESGHSSGIFFRVSRWGWAAIAEEKEQNFLTITTDKNIYYTGDVAHISFESPKNGMALFTLEQGNRIISREIKPVTSGPATFTFNVTDDLVPNCYAVISLMQPHGQSENDLPMRVYGVKPIFVEDLSTRLNLTMKAPDEIGPNEKFTVSVTSKAPRPATYTIAVVDEGLLDLTGFDTPDPWKHYFKKIRLGVTSRDNFNEIIGMLLPDMDKYFSIGGGLEGQRKKRAGEHKVQRFKPVVLFQRPVTILPGKTKKATFTMPNYVGSVRVMVVACSQHSYSSLEKTIPVRQPLMLLTTIPRVARPRDLFAVPVSVFVMDSSVNKVLVSAKVSDKLVLQGDATQTVLFDHPGEKDIAFSIKISDNIGAGTINITASSDKHKTYDKVELPIICPNPFYTRVTDTVIVQKGSLTIIPEMIGIEGTNSARLSFTRIPDIQLHKRFKYLLRYPYGCIEQTLSAGFPQLYLSSILDLSSREKQATTDNINATIDRLQRFIIPGNGFSYWPGSHYYKSEYSDWCTNYTGHFLIEAKDAGYHVPKSLLKHWEKSAQKRAKKVNRKNHRYQGYRLFLLSLAGKPHQGAMNLMRENYLSELDPLSKKFLATAYYLAGQKDAAKNIDSYSATEITDYRELSGTFGSALRDRAMITYLALKMNDIKTASRLIRSVTKRFTPSGWYSTQETAITLLALSNLYIKSPITGGAVKFTIKKEGKKQEKMALKGYQVSYDLDNWWDKKVNISSQSDNPLFISLLEEGIPLEDRIETENQGIELTRNFYDDDGRPMSINNIKQGNPFWVRYRVRSAESDNLKEIALSSLFPSGWEIINLRLENLTPPEWVMKLKPCNGKYLDLRDDRANWFFDLYARGELNFLIKLNPSFKGTYHLPPVLVEAMYSPEYYARIKGGEISVK